MSVSIREYKLKDLECLLSDEAFWGASQLPITRHRALAQFHNPRAEPNDAVLFVAQDENRLAGYIGVVPDHIFLPGTKSRMGWLTGWWADPDPRYRGTGLFLMSKALQSYGGQVGASDFTSDAERVYIASRQFRVVKELSGLTLLLGLSPELLKQRQPKLVENWSALVEGAGASLRAVLAPRWISWRKRHDPGRSVSVEYVNTIGAKGQELLASCQTKELFRRDGEDLTWILQYPWVLPGPLSALQSNRYYFSSTARSFGFICFKVIENPSANVIGLVVLRIADGHMHVPYCYFKQDHADLICTLIARHALELRVDRLTLFHPELLRAQETLKLPALRSISVTRKWALSTRLADLLPKDFQLQAGDGDCVFA